MKNETTPGILLLSTAMLLGAGLRVGVASPPPPQSQSVSSGVEVNRVLLNLPNYSVFDWVGGTVAGKDVILTGEVTDETLKRLAENAVKRVRGVRNVTDNIRVLPDSNSDERLRQAVFDAFSSDPTLRPHTTRLQCRIHIIVENSRVSLKGSVPNPQEGNLAALRAQAVPGVRTVRNELQVQY